MASTKGVATLLTGEGSRPRDPLCPKPTALPEQGRKYTLGFEDTCTARGDARPPGQGSSTAYGYDPSRRPRDDVRHSRNGG
jgi:hypothetical protein